MDPYPAQILQTFLVEIRAKLGFWTFIIVVAWVEPEF